MGSRCSRARRRKLPISRKRINRKAAALAASNRKGWISRGHRRCLGARFVRHCAFRRPNCFAEPMVRAQAVAWNGHRPGGEQPSARHGRPKTRRTSQGRWRAPEVSRLPPPCRPRLRKVEPAYLSVGFEKLAAFPFEVTYHMLDDQHGPQSAAAETLRQIPDEVKALNDQEVSREGLYAPNDIGARAGNGVPDLEESKHVLLRHTPEDHRMGQRPVRQARASSRSWISR